METVTTGADLVPRVSLTSVTWRRDDTRNSSSRLKRIKTRCCQLGCRVVEPVFRRFLRVAIAASANDLSAASVPGVRWRGIR